MASSQSQDGLDSHPQFEGAHVEYNEEVPHGPKADSPHQGNSAKEPRFRFGETPEDSDTEASEAETQAA